MVTRDLRARAAPPQPVPARPPVRGPFDFPRGIEDAAVRRRTVELARAGGIVLPTFADMADPQRVPPAQLAPLANIGPDELHPANLFRVHWFNDVDRRR